MHEIFGSDSCRKPNENSIKESVLSQVFKRLENKEPRDIDFLTDWSKNNQHDIYTVVFDGPIQHTLIECLM